MKKTVSILLSIVMLCSGLAVFASAYGENNITISQTILPDKNYNIADANGDKSVNAVDSYSVKASIAGHEDVEVSIDAGDLNADGKLSSADVYYLQTILAGVRSASSFENGQTVNTFKIGGADISEFVIVLPEDTEYSDNIYYSYELLRAYVNRVTGVDLSKVYGGEGVEHGIYFNNVKGTELGDELGADGYYFYVENGNLYINGTLRGNMYAVYEILEKYLGLFFYDNSYTLSSKVRCANLEEGLSEKYVPAFEARAVGTNFWGSTRECHYFARKLNFATNFPNEGDSYYGWSVGSKFNNAHSYWYYKPMAQGEWPEDDGTMSLADMYYQKFVNGGGLSYSDSGTPQPCAVDDYEFDTLYEGMLLVNGMLRARGYDFNFEDRQNSISFSINDGDDYCKCKVCKAIANGTDIARVTKGIGNTLKSMQEWYCGDFTYDETAAKASFPKEGYPALYVALANRAAERIKNDIPGARILTIIYDSILPATIKPGDNIILWYCGTISGCITHHFGEECNISTAVTGTDLANFHSDASDALAIDTWVKLANESGAQVYFWYYPENYSFYLYDAPVIFDMYYDYQWLAMHGVKGMYYEGSGKTFCCFERIKSSLASELAWNPYMTMDEYKLLIKKYLKAEYGYGYEHVYNYLIELENAAAEVTVCVPFFCGAFDSFSKTYIAEHYEYMRNELLLAKEQKGNIGFSGTGAGLDTLLMSCEVLGLSACYDSMYTNGTSDSRKTYEERYTWVYNFIKNNNLTCGVDPSFKLPDSISFSESILMQVFRMEHRYKTKGYYCE